MSDGAAQLDTLWRTLTLQGGHNTNVVLLGTAVLGVTCGVIGAFLLLRKRSLVADGLSHAALPGVCVGFLLSLAMGGDGRSILVLLPAAAVFGLIGVATIHLLTTLPRVKEDAAIGVVLSVFFAGGVVLLSHIQSMSVAGQAGLGYFLFGQAAAMVEGEAKLLGVIAVCLLVATTLVFKELRLLCFDAPFARSLGRSTLLLDGILLALVTLVTVTGIYVVGAILMVALLILPPVAARFWTNRLLTMVIVAGLMGGIGCYVGATASASLRNVPAGPAIVMACGVLFIVGLLGAPKRGLIAAIVRRRRMARLVARQHLLRALYEQSEIVGDIDSIMTVDQLARRRRWYESTLRRSLSRAVRAAEITRVDGGFVFTEQGRDAAKRITRSHRLWEFYLTSHADIAPSHVDRCADDIEHVLGDEFVSRLEDALIATGELIPGRTVPQSPHDLVESGAAPP